MVLVGLAAAVNSKGANMTVKEMKEVLENYPDECELFGTDGHNWFPLDFPERKNETDIVFYSERF